MKILVIEDNEQFALMLCDALRGEGFETEAALSGKAGIKTAMAYLPDLILLDYHLGDMTGYDVATGIRCMRATTFTPFVLLSSMAADPFLTSGFKKLSNCRATLVKTQPLSEIIEAVRKVLSDKEDLAR
ncbi:MAG TPA: hypothetical protein DEQ38_11720 [Elusimicrobia bacterium]|nr:hypothetical protein [Elusimicrobiota bacterium]